jgi:hypothetical protein
LRILETATGKEVRSITTGLDGPGFQPILSRDNKRLVVAGMKGGKAVLTVYDATDGKELHQLAVPPPVADSEDLPPGIALPVTLPRLTLFSPDGRMLAALLDARRVALWDVTRGRELPMIEGPKDHGIQSMAFSPDGKTLAMDFDDFVPRLYEVTTGHERSHYETKQTGTPAPQFLAPPPPPFFAGIAIDGEMISSTQGDVAISPDGRLLVHCRHGGAIGVWNVATRKEIGQLIGHQAQVTSLTFSSDGKTLASGSRDTTALLWDMTKFLEAAKPQPAKVDAATRWTDLLGTDAARAFDAICSFATTPAESIAFLKERARPAAPSDAEKVERLIAELDSPRFAERKNASGELEKLGESAIPLLRKALEGDPTPEARKRIEELLKKTDSIAPRGELLRSLRVVEVLESIATPEAKAILQTLAKGTAEATLTRSAQAALDRLAR